MTGSLFIHYVADQARARAFYRALLETEPRTDVPGMTEFALPGGGALGLMPRTSIEALLPDGLPPAGSGSELYLRVPGVEAAVERALAAGATCISPLEQRSWGDDVAYLVDPEGQVLALARWTDLPNAVMDREDEATGPVAEAPMEGDGPAGSGRGSRPVGTGWYVANLRDLPWQANPRFGTTNRFEQPDPDGRFTGFGLHVHRLEPGQPACLYHREDAQEGFLVLEGAARVLVEGQERALATWDYFHCPPGVNHVLVGAGEGTCTILMIGRRDADRKLFYPLDALAASFGAAAEAPTPEPMEAYAGTPPSEPCEAPWPIGDGPDQEED